VVPFSVKLPDVVDVGEHDGCIAIQEENQSSKSAGNGVALTFRTALRVAITVPGKIVKSLEFEGIKTSTSGKGTVVVTPTIQNTGNVSLDTKLRTELVPILGVSVTQDNGSYPILPRSKASWNLELKQPFWGGIYKARVQASYNADPNDGIGDTSGKTKTIASESSFVFVAPKPLALIIELAVIAAIAAAVYALYRRAKHTSHVRTSWHKYTVKDHDTIIKIAKHHDIGWKRLATANKLKAPYHLEPGQELKVPPKKGV
jgi:hypothetical protein